MYDVKIIGDEVLRKQALPVAEFDERLARIADGMLETMHSKDGIGLAAPQVGISQRLIVVDISPIDKSAEAMVFVNPEIVTSSGEICMEEGCLSVPGVNEEVTRSEEIELKYYTLSGDEKTAVFNGWMARVIQHEIDHLNGILFIDYLSPLKRKLVSSKLSVLM
jgi:peptide deformylase